MYQKLLKKIHPLKNRLKPKIRKEKRIYHFLQTSLHNRKQKQSSLMPQLQTGRQLQQMKLNPQQGLIQHQKPLLLPIQAKQLLQQKQKILLKLKQEHMLKIALPKTRICYRQKKLYNLLKNRCSRLRKTRNRKMQNLKKN